MKDSSRHVGGGRCGFNKDYPLSPRARTGVRTMLPIHGVFFVCEQLVAQAFVANNVPCFSLYMFFTHLILD